MDKYELNIKIDKMKKAVERKDYATAAKVADGLNWEKSTNAKVLMMIAQIYEKLERYSDARSALSVVYHRVPVGKRIVYKLTELSIKCGDLDEAAELYREFQEIAPNDPSKLILAYRIANARDESLEKRIAILEAYGRREFDEKWSYELATLYQQAGKVDECVALCDEIILWFGVGPYVDKAMSLKMMFAPLSPEQEEKRANRKYYEQQLNAVATQSWKEAQDKDVPELKSFQRPTQSPLTAPADKNAKITSDHIMALEQELANSIQYRPEDQIIPETDVWVTDQPMSVDRVGQDVDGQYTLFRTVSEESGDKAVPGETRTFSFGSMLTKTRRLNSLQDLKLNADTTDEVAVVSASEAEEVPEEIETPVETAHEAVPDETEAPVENEVEEVSEESEAPVEAEVEEVSEESEAPVEAEVEEVSEETEAPIEEEVEEVSEEPEAPVEDEYQLIVEELEDTAKDKLFCYFIAYNDDVSRLEQVKEAHPLAHEVSGIPVAPVARIAVEKINHVGLFAALKKLNGRDLLLDNAGDLAPVVLEQLYTAINEPPCTALVLLADTDEGLRKIADKAPELYALFAAEEEDDDFDEDDIEFDLSALDSILKEEAEKDEDDEKDNEVAEYSDEDDSDEDDFDDEDEDEVEDEQTEADALHEGPIDDSDLIPLTTDAFIAYLHVYAEENDCRFDEMGELALAARIDKMELTHSPMNRKSAREFLDKVIDRAERFSLRTLFVSKYDSEGFLVLKEKHFS